MAIEITSDTVVKILVRRGTNSERKLTTLTEGEIGYTIDSQRMFIGDGITPGGHPAGNLFLGVATSKDPYSSLAEVGDLIYVTDGSGNNTAQVLYSYTGEGIEKWTDIHPKPYSAESNNITSIEKSPLGKWRVAGELVMGNTPTAPTGFSLVYDDESTKSLNTLAHIYNRLEFDRRFLSLSAFNTDNPATIRPSFYFGDISKRGTITNNFDATVNIDKNLFINSQQNESQIQFYSSDPSRPVNPLIRCTRGNLVVASNDGIYLNTIRGNRDLWGIKLDGTINNNTVVTTFSAISAGPYNSPDHIFEGTTVFRGPVYTDPGADLTVYGNLSVFGDITYLDTVVTSTSSLSVVNYNVSADVPTLVVGQMNNTSIFGQTIARFIEGGFNTPIMAIKEAQSISMFCENYYLNNGSYNLVVSGDSFFGPHKTLGFGRFTVDQTSRAQGGGNNENISLKGYSVRITSDNQNISYNNCITLDTNDNTGFESRYVQVLGGLRSTGDIIAFSSSDERLKDNKKNISNALEIVNNLNGITFDWNEKSGKTGRDYGVIAQEVEKYLPEVVLTRDNGYKAVRYEKLIPVLLEAIKELKTQLDNKS